MRLRGLAALVAVSISTVLSAQSTQTGLVSPEAFFGFKMGADRELVDWPGLVRYFETVDRASNRVELVEAGRSTEGQRLMAAIVTAPEHFARLDQIRAASLRLADPRTLEDSAANTLIANQPVIVAIGMSIHASEIGATQAASELLHTLATAQDADTLRTLRDVVLILFPSLNPDGHELVVDWYRKWKGTPFEGGPMPWLYHRYAGHDLNRDAFMMNMVENRALADFFYRRWRPQVFLAMHQMGQYGARLFVPPNIDPIDPNHDPLIWRTAGLLGHAMALRLEQDGRTGVVQNALYDYYSPGYEDSALLGHNTVSLLSEAASVHIATPITISQTELQGGRGFPDQQPSMAFPHPWPGGTWRLRDIVEYELSALNGLLTGVSRYRADLVNNFYRMGQRQIARGLQGGPFAFVIPPDQYDVHAARALTAVLIDGAVDVERALEPFRVGETVYPEGTNVVLMAQPSRAFAKTLLEVQNYPSRRMMDGTLPDRPYDVAGWTLPLQMNVRVDRIERPFDLPTTTRLDRATIAPARVWGETRRATYYVIDGRGNGASIAINRLLKSGAPVSWLTASLPLQGFTYEPGSIVVRDGSGVRALVDTIASQFGLRATAASGRLPQAARQLMPARVGVYKSWVENVDEGWTRWLLEQYEFGFETITDADIKRGNLRSRFDAIVLPDQNADRTLIGNPVGTVPQEYAGGLGVAGASMLKQFVDTGGTLVALDSSSSLAIGLLGAPVKDATRGVGSDEFFCPGSIVRLELSSDPLTYGVPSETAGFFSFGSAFELSASDSTAPEPAALPTARIIGRYGRSRVLLSGWLDGEQVIAGKGAIVEVRSGLGRAVLFGFRPQHRAQSHATFRLLFNALHTSRRVDGSVQGTERLNQ